MVETQTVIAESAATAKASDLVGSWSITVSETEGLPTRMLLTLNADGTLVTAEHPVVTPPGAPGPIFTSSGHGSWRTPDQENAEFMFVTLGSDGSGELFAIVTSSGVLEFSAGRNIVVGEMTATIDDPTGKRLAVFPLTLRGVRIDIQPPG